MTGTNYPEQLFELLCRLSSLALETLAADNGTTVLQKSVRSLVLTKTDGYQHQKETLLAISTLVEQQIKGSPYARTLNRALTESGLLLADQSQQELLRGQQELCSLQQEILNCVQEKRQYSPPSKMPKAEKQRLIKKLVKLLVPYESLLVPLPPTENTSYEAKEALPEICCRFIYTLDTYFQGHPLHGQRGRWLSLTAVSSATGGPSFGSPNNWYNIARGRQISRHDDLLPWLIDQVSLMEKEVWHTGPPTPAPLQPSMSAASAAQLKELCQRLAPYELWLAPAIQSQSLNEQQAFPEIVRRFIATLGNYYRDQSGGSGSQFSRLPEIARKSNGPIFGERTWGNNAEGKTSSEQVLPWLCTRLGILEKIKKSAPDARLLRGSIRTKRA
jgi:hypothetical protein